MHYLRLLVSMALKVRAEILVPQPSKSPPRQCFLQVTAYSLFTALRSHDFAILHREYIGFENPYQIRLLLIRIYIRIGTDSICTQKSVRNLIVTKIKTSEQK